METKVCSKCGKEYPLDYFYTIKDKVTGEIKYRYTYDKYCHYKMTKPKAKQWRKKYPKRWQQDVRNAQKAYHERQKEGVYLLVTNKGLYVGQTDKYQSRILQHKNHDFNGNVKYYGAKVLFHMLIVEENNKQKRQEIEKFWINLLKPALNKMANPDWYKPGMGKKYVRK